MLEELLSDELLSAMNSDSDSDNDAILLEASNVYESSQTTQLPAPPTTTTTVSTSPTPLPSAKKPRFAPPKLDEEILEDRKHGIPAKTLQDTKYCFNIWEEWRKHRQQCTGENIDELHELSIEMLQHWLIRFILEVRKKDGEVYQPNTLHHITAGLMRHIRWNGKPHVDLFKDAKFADFRATLDAEMKRLQSLGIGSKKKRAEILTEEEEEILWKQDLLGDKTPRTLLDTIIFYNGLYFALRSGKEHRQLRNSPCQIEIVEQCGKRSFLKYTEDISKNHPGGLKGRKITPKVVLHHQNLDNPQRCFVRLFKMYRQMCPADAPPDAFYLQPSKKPSSSCWYTKSPLGHSSLSTTVARLCKSAGIDGFKTNHSLRATATSRLYQSGVDEQLVMERTGHRSIEGVRSYKRTSDSQREALSDILNGPKRPKSATNSSPPATSVFSSTQQSQQLNLSSATFQNCTVNFFSCLPTRDSD